MAIKKKILELEPYYRKKKLVQWMRDRLTYMSIHTATDLPLVRYGRRMSVEERNKPIILKQDIKFKDKLLEQTLSISYNNILGAPSYRIYDILMAIYWYMQENGYNDGTLYWEGINWIRKMIGGNSTTIKNDLEKLTGVHIRGRRVLFNMQTGEHYDIDIAPFPTFVRECVEGNTLPRNCIFEINEFWIKYIQNNIMNTPQTYIDYFALKSVLAKLLFTRLIKIFYKRDFYTADMEKLGRWLLLEDKSIHSMKQSFERAGRQLCDIGLLIKEPKIEPQRGGFGYNITFVKSKKVTKECAEWLKPPDYELGYVKEQIVMGSMDSELDDNEDGFCSDGYKT